MILFGTCGDGTLIPQRFAIRPSLRNHNLLSRDEVIQTVARLVGRGHQVDLKYYDLLITVDIFKVCSTENRRCDVY
jgi:tRNA(Ser,Leu) C12 N-acetylase TAN1